MSSKPKRQRLPTRRPTPPAVSAATQIYASIHGIRPRDSRRHKEEQLAHLLLRVGCTVFDHWTFFEVVLPGETERLGLRAARNRARKAGLLRGVLSGTEVPALRLRTRMHRDRQTIDIAMWCVSCQSLHMHGGWFGSRVAHCHDQLGAYEGGGYVLREVQIVA